MQYPRIYQTTPRHHTLRLQCAFPQLFELTIKLCVLEDSGFTQPMGVGVGVGVWGVGVYRQGKRELHIQIHILQLQIQIPKCQIQIHILKKKCTNPHFTNRCS